jgi:16S rRNA (cytidine1402-2'-O)-methyltransferase
VSGGRLFVVATPIGHLGDITLRAIETLRAVDLIACEDTRHTRKLLHHHGISTRTVSYHQHNERTRCPRLVRRLLDGSDLALVTDAGTPSISDPGYLLVRRAREAGCAVIPIPGACAAIAAISAAGLPAERILFEGFLPARRAARQARIRAFADRTETIVLYEAPHRIRAALADLTALLGDRQAALVRECTKRHEEWIHGTPADIAAQLSSPVRGEITVVLTGSTGPAGGEGSGAAVTDDQLLAAIEAAGGGSRAAAIAAAARRLGLGRREAYRRWLQLRDRDRGTS